MLLSRTESTRPRILFSDTTVASHIQGTSVPVAIPTAARLRMAQHAAASGAHDGIRAATFVPPHQLLAQLDGRDADVFSLGFSMGVRPNRHHYTQSHGPIVRHDLST